MDKKQQQPQDESEIAIQQFKIKRMIKTLTFAKGDGTSRITILIPPRKAISEVTTKLTEEFGKASNIKDKRNAQSVESCIIAVRERLRLYNNRTPPNGLVLFCGQIQEEGKAEKRLLLDFEPFRPINVSAYFCDTQFHTEDLTCLLDTDPPFGFIVVDGCGAMYATLQGNAKEILNKFSVELPKKHGRGGQSSVRFARLRLEKRHNYLRKVAEIATQCFITNDRPNVIGLILAGSADFKTDLQKSDMFDQRLRPLVIKTVDVAYGGENGLNQAIELAEENLAQVKFVREKNLVSKFFENIDMDTGLVVYGVEDSVRAILAGGVETIVCWEALPYNRVALKNRETGELIVKYVRETEMNDQKLLTDAKTLAEYDIEESMNLVEWLTENFKNHGCQLQLITNKSSEGFQFCKGFTGLAGFLRYKIELEYLVSSNKEAWKDEDDDFI